MSAQRPFRIFVSSPGDVSEERKIAERVITRLAWRYRGRLEIAPYLYEHQPFSGHEGFQSQIPSTAEFDAVIVILWSRLGTRLGPQHRRPDGTEYESGTQKELEEAVEARRAAGEAGRPDLGVYVKRRRHTIDLADPEAPERVEQYRKLTSFLERWEKDPQTSAFHRAINYFEDGAHFEELLAKQLDHAARRALPAVIAATFATDREVSLHGCPFRGLSSFELEHESNFFGRTRQTAEILERLRERARSGVPMIVLVGHSGAGKSSLAQAGVLPTVITPGIVEHVAEWRHAVVRLARGRDPFALLADALWQDLPRSEGAKLAPTASQLRDRLRHDSGATIRDHLDRVEALRLAERGTSLSNPIRLALVVDGLEALLDEGAAEERTAFAASLLALARQGVWIIATMRIDYLHRCRELPALDQAIQGSGLYEVGAPSRQELAQIVIDRARAAGLGFESDPTTGVRLDELILKDAEEVADNLCLLEFTLESLYERRAADPSIQEAPNGILRLDVYRSELRRLRGALAKRAGEAQATLTEGQRRLLGSLFARLVDVGRDELARRCPCRRDDPDRAAGLLELIEALVSARILVADVDDRGVSVVRLAHDSLLTDPDAWPELHSWLASTRDALLARDELARDAARWRARPTPDRLRLAGARFEQELELLRHPEVGPTVNDDSRRFLEASQVAIDQAAARAKALLRARQILTVLFALAAGAAFWAWRLADGRLAEARQQLYLSSLARGAMSISEERAKDAIEALSLCPPEHRSWEWGFLRGLADQSAAVLPKEEAKALAVAIDDQGGRVLIGCEGGVVRTIDWPKGAASPGKPATLRLRGRVLDVEFDTLGRPLVLTTGDRGVHLHTLAVQSADSSSPESVQQVDCMIREPVLGRIAADGSRALLRDSAAQSARIEVVDLTSQQATSTWAAVQNLAGAAAAPRSSDACSVTLHTLKGQMTRWLRGAGPALADSPIDSTSLHTSPASLVSFSASGHMVTGSRSEGSLVCYDPTQHVLTPLMRLPHRGLSAVALSEVLPESAVVLAGTESGALVCVTLGPLSASEDEAFAAVTSAGPGKTDDALVPSSMRCLLGHGDPILAVAINAAGTRAVSLCEEGLIRLWELDQRGRVLELSHGMANVERLRFSGADGVVLIEDDAESLLPIRAPSIAERPGETGPDRKPESIAISRCGTRLLERVGDELVLCRAGATGPAPTLARWSAPRECIPGRTLAWSSDLETVVEATTASGVTRLWVRRWSSEAPGSRAEPLSPELHEPLRSISVSDDGSVIAASMTSGRLLVWSAQGAREVAGAAVLDSLDSPSLHECLRSMELPSKFLDHRGTRLAITGIVETAGVRSGKFMLLKLPSGEVQLEQEWPGVSISALAFGPSDDLVSTGDERGVIRVWSTRTGREVATLRGHAKAISGLALHPDGDRLASAAEGERLRVWSVRWGTSLLQLPLNVTGARALAFDAEGRRLGAVVPDRLSVLDGGPR